MTLEKIKRLCRDISSYYFSTIKSVEQYKWNTSPNMLDKKRHMKYLCDEAQDYGEEYLSHAHWTLGFIQGSMWAIDMVQRNAILRMNRKNDN